MGIFIALNNGLVTRWGSTPVRTPANRARTAGRPQSETGRHRPHGSRPSSGDDGVLAEHHPDHHTTIKRAPDAGHPAAAAAGWERLSPRHVGKACVGADECELRDTRRTVAVLCHDQLGGASLG
jgi:hypothetical protein